MPRRGTSNEYPQHMFSWRNKKYINTFGMKKASDLESYATCSLAGLGGSVGCASDWRPGGCGFDSRRGRQHSLVEIDHEIFSTVIPSLLLIQEGQLSVSGKRMCTILVNHLEDQACPVNMWLGKLTTLDITPLG